MAEAVMKERKLEVVDQANHGEGVDRISNLPEPLAHDIMSFLPEIDVARTSTLSKRFYSNWSSFPVISFDENRFRGNSGMLEGNSDESRNIFLDFVVGSIQLRQLETNLVKFSLKCDLYNTKSDYDHEVDVVINFALENSVKDLNLDFLGYGIDDDEMLYHMKETFSLKSVTFLKLIGLSLNLSWLFSTCPLMESLALCKCFVSEDIINPCEGNIGAAGRSLRLLSLHNVNITENWVENYVPKFSALEILEMSQCNALENIWVSNDHVKEITLNYNFMLETIKIVAPELHSFQHTGVFKPCTIDIAACKLIKNLSLKQVRITDEWLTTNVALFSHLEILSLEICVDLVHIKIVSKNLQNLELLGDINFVEVMIDTPNLKSFNYQGNVVLFGLMNAPRLRNPTLKLISYGPDQTVAWYYGLRDLLTMFDHCESLTLLTNSTHRDFIFPEDVRDATLPPLYDIKTLHIDVWLVSNILPIDLVDSLLWICPLVETLNFVSTFVDKTIKFRYARMQNQDLGTQQNCCKYLTCWRHHLRKIEMHNFDEIDERHGLLEYFRKECQLAGNTTLEFQFLQTGSKPIFAVAPFVLP